eukprot:686725-Pelagomonas_calceolata.AAC.3
MVPQPASYVSSILAERAFTEDAWYKQAVWVNCSPISQVGRLRGFKHLHNNVSSSPTQYAHLDERRGAVLFSGDMARRWCVFSRASRTSVVCGTSAALCSSGPRPRLDRTMSSAACTKVNQEEKEYQKCARRPVKEWHRFPLFAVQFIAYCNRNYYWHPARPKTACRCRALIVSVTWIAYLGKKGTSLVQAYLRDPVHLQHSCLCHLSKAAQKSMNIRGKLAHLGHQPGLPAFRCMSCPPSPS